MKKKVDIDALLAENRLTLVLDGKTYELKDVSISVFMMASGSDPSEDVLHKQLAMILKVDEEELADVGLKAAALTLKEIRDWVMESSFEQEDEKASVEEKVVAPKNP